MAPKLCATCTSCPHPPSTFISRRLGAQRVCVRERRERFARGERESPPCCELAPLESGGRPPATNVQVRKVTSHRFVSLWRYLTPIAAAPARLRFQPLPATHYAWEVPMFFCPTACLLSHPVGSTQHRGQRVEAEGREPLEPLTSLGVLPSICHAMLWHSMPCHAMCIYLTHALPEAPAPASRNNQRQTDSPWRRMFSCLRNTKLPPLRGLRRDAVPCTMAARRCRDRLSCIQINTDWIRLWSASLPACSAD